MGVQASDFGTARVTRQRYVQPDRTLGFVAAYERDFAAGTVRLGTRRLLELVSTVSFASDLANADDYLGNEPYVARLFFFQQGLSAAFSTLHPTYLRFGKVIRIRAGDAASEVTVRVGTSLGEIRVLLVFAQVDQVVDVVIAIGYPRSPIGLTEASALARLAAGHTRAGLVPVSAAPPIISGTLTVGQTISATTGGWSNKPSRFAYSWERCDASGLNCAATGSTGSTYAVETADAGSTLRVVVTATNSVGSSKPATSAATTPVVAPPANTAPPAITGTAVVGQQLTAAPGTWTGSPTFAYQWQRCDSTGANCAPIVGADATTYAVAPADVGSTLRVSVTATNSTGGATAISAATATVT